MTSDDVLQSRDSVMDGPRRAREMRALVQGGARHTAVMNIDEFLQSNDYVIDES